MSGAKRSLSMREKILAGATGLVLLVTAIKFLVLDPVLQSRRLRAQIATAQTELAAATMDLAQKQSARAPSSAPGLPDVQMRAVIEENSSLTSLVRKLAEASAADGFRLRRVEQKKSETVNGIEAIHYDVMVQAPFLLAGRFIESLEKSPLLIELKSMKVSRDGDDLRRVLVQLSLVNHVVREGK